MICSSKSGICKLFFIFLLPFFTSIDSYSATGCKLTKGDVSYAVRSIKKNRNLIKSLSECQKSDHNLIRELVKISPKNLSYASESLRSNQLFINQFAIEDPNNLQYASKDLLSDPLYISSITKVHASALQYADPDLLDNKIFIKKMIKMDPRNFIYASNRLQNDFKTTLLAVEADGEMFKFASERMQNNKTIVRQAVKSYTPIVHLLEKKWQDDWKVKELVSQANHDFLGGIKTFLKDNYSGIPVGPGGGRGYRIVNFGKFFGEDMHLINRPYATKWKVVYEDGVESKQSKLVPGKNKNISWKEDFQDYPMLIKEISSVFYDNQVDDNTIDSLQLLSLWTASDDDSDVLVFELYLLRDVRREYLSPVFSNITSMTAIARKSEDGGEWEITVIDNMFDLDIKADSRFKNGHKKYYVWDLYESSDEDGDLKVLFKVEGSDSQHFELFAKQPNGRYARIFSGGGYSIDDY